MNSFSLPTYLFIFLLPLECVMDISTKEEILCRPLVDVTHIDIQSVIVAASNCAEFDIKLCVKRKTQESLGVNCHFVAVTCIGRKPTHFLITFGLETNNSVIIEHTSNPDNLIVNQLPVSNTQQSQQPLITPKTNAEPRGSLHGSIRRGKYSTFFYVWNF